MATKAKKQRTKKKTHRFQLTMPGIVGVAVVSFCLFLWMFLLGIWAGQTFLLPAAKPGVTLQSGHSGSDGRSVETLASSAKKKPAAAGHK